MRDTQAVNKNEISRNVFYSILLGESYNWEYYITLELPTVKRKLFLPKPIKMPGLQKIRNNRIYLYLLIYYFLTKRTP